MIQPEMEFRGNWDLEELGAQNIEEENIEEGRRVAL
jgi:hypothetical protein